MADVLWNNNRCVICPSVGANKVRTGAHLARACVCKTGADKCTYTNVKSRSSGARWWVMMVGTRA